MPLDVVATAAGVTDNTVDDSGDSIGHPPTVGIGNNLRGQVLYQVGNSGNLLARKGLGGRGQLFSQGVGGWMSNNYPLPPHSD
jgi:hypothetical protein